MTDRELLELAAKAAGLKHVDYSGIDYDGRLGIVLVDEIGRHCSDWNPLADDGDALRLAADLSIDVMFAKEIHPMHAHKVVSAFTSDNQRFDELMHDKMRATRRAIVRAAAEIGRNM